MEQKIHDINVQMVIVFQVEIIPIGTVIAHQPKLGTHQLWNNVFVSKIIKLLGLAMTMGPKCLFGTYLQFFQTMDEKIQPHQYGTSRRIVFVRFWKNLTDLYQILQISSRISNLKSLILNFLTIICFDLFLNTPANWKKACFGPIKNLFSFSTIKTGKDSWKKLVNQIGASI